MTWETVDWSKTNVEIAQEMGCSREWVRLKRMKAGLPPSNGRSAMWDAHNENLKQRMLEAGAGTVTDAELAKRIGMSRHGVSQARRRCGLESSWKPLVDWDNEERLGKMPDLRLGMLLGVGQNDVWRARTARGIPAFTGPHERVCKPWNPENDHLLGTMTDGALSNVIGYSSIAILHRRKKLGIPPFQKRRSGTEGGV